MPRFCQIIILLVALSCIGPTAVAQSALQDSNPCESGLGVAAAAPDEGTILPTDQSSLVAPKDATHGLFPTGGDSLVYDQNQGLCWLADANMAGYPEIRDLIRVPGVNPDGTMTYAVALKWVEALNNYDGGKGLLGHKNWQLPVTPKFDSTKCSSSNKGTFGVLCSGSALGNLYSVGLNLNFPSSAVPHFEDAVEGFRNLQPGLYWTSDSDSGGEVTFSFNTGLYGANTTKYNYFHVLPVTKELLGFPPVGKGVLPYTSGIAAGKAVFDSDTGLSWTLDANLAAQETFGVAGNSTMGPTIENTYLTRPRIDVDGSMLFETIAGPDGWLTALNAREYAGSTKWKIPSLDDIQTLYRDLHLRMGDTRLQTYASLGPFFNLQPSFYWSCERKQSGDSQSPCDPSLYPSKNADGIKFEYSFDFDNGFEGTDFDTKEFYVMVYYPAPSTATSASPVIGGLQFGKSFSSLAPQGKDSTDMQPEGCPIYPKTCEGMTPSLAFYNVMSDDFFPGTRVAPTFGDSQTVDVNNFDYTDAPMNFLQIYSADILYADGLSNCSMLEKTGGPFYKVPPNLKKCAAKAGTELYIDAGNTEEELELTSVNRLRISEPLP